MANPGVFTLAALSIGAPKPAIVLSPIVDLEGISAVSLEAALLYGSGGSSVSVFVVTSLDGGETWRQVARFNFTTASAVKIATIASSVYGVQAYADLSSEGINQGPIGNLLAAYVVSSGTYLNTALSVRAATREGFVLQRPTIVLTLAPGWSFA